MTTTEYPKCAGVQAPTIESGIESVIGRSFDSAQSDPITSRAHRRFKWRTPSGGKKRPSVIVATTRELARGLEKRLGSLYQRFSGLAPVAGYSAQQRAAGPRQRRWRGDGVESALCMAVALCHASDIRTGFIGRPRREGGGWERFGVRDLAHFAYQATDDATLKRAGRALFVLESLGILTLATQIRKTTAAGEIRSENAIRRLNWTRLAELCNTSWLLTKDRAALDRRAADTHAKPAAVSAVSHQHAEREPRTRPQPARRPPERSGGFQHALDVLHGLA